jgi:hypothetical protein
MIIAIDFDGTCVTHDYPKIGKDIGAAIFLRLMVENGHKLILWTMRSGIPLEEAVKWFDINGIKLWGINQNPDQNWTTSPKAFAQLYIDDAGLGCPLTVDERISPRPFANWPSIAMMLDHVLAPPETPAAE